MRISLNAPPLFAFGAMASTPLQARVAVILDRLPEPLQPLVTGLSIRRSLYHNRQQLALRPAHRAAEGPEEVSTCSNAGQILSRLPTTSPAEMASTLATFLISATASFRRRQAKREPFHRPGTKPRLEPQVCFVCIE
jgi:hypothetical protein